MALYSLTCPRCNLDWEKIASFKEYDGGLHCPVCGQLAEHKQEGFSFRGFFRWYKPSDYGKPRHGGYLKPQEIVNGTTQERTIPTQENEPVPSDDLGDS